MEIAPVAGLRGDTPAGDGIEPVLRDLRRVRQTRSALTVTDPRRISMADCCVICSAADWDAIEAALGQLRFFV